MVGSLLLVAGLVLAMLAPVYLVIFARWDAYLAGDPLDQFVAHLLLLPSYSMLLLLLVHLFFRFRVIACLLLHSVDDRLAVLLWTLRVFGIVITFFTWTCIFLIIPTHLVTCFALFPIAGVYALCLRLRGRTETAAKVFPAYRGVCSTSWAFTMWITFPFVLFPKAYVIPQVPRTLGHCGICVTFGVFVCFAICLPCADVAAAGYYVYLLTTGKIPVADSQLVTLALASCAVGFAAWLLSGVFMVMRFGQLLCSQETPEVEVYTLFQEIVGNRYSRSWLPATACLVIFLGACAGDFLWLVFFSLALPDSLPEAGTTAYAMTVLKVATSALMFVFGFCWGYQKYVYGRECGRPSGHYILFCLLASSLLFVAALFIPVTGLLNNHA